MLLSLGRAWHHCQGAMTQLTETPSSHPPTSLSHPRDATPTRTDTPKQSPNS